MFNNLTILDMSTTFIDTREITTRPRLQLNLPKRVLINRLQLMSGLTTRSVKRVESTRPWQSIVSRQ